MLNRGRWKELAAALLLVCCFWNVFYPEFSLTGDSYRRNDPKAGEGMTLPGQIKEDYYGILEASDGEVEIRFGLLEGAGYSGIAQKKEAYREILQEIAGALGERS